MINVQDAALFELVQLVWQKYRAECSRIGPGISHLGVPHVNKTILTNNMYRWFAG